jgi:hypothetical protein
MTGQFFVKLMDVKFYEYPFSRSRDVACGESDGLTEGAILIGVFLLSEEAETHLYILLID